MRDPLECTFIKVWTTNLLYDTMVFGMLREDTEHASIFTSDTCAYKVVSVSGTRLTDQTICSNQPVYAYGQMYQAQHTEGYMPVKLEVIAACCQEHTSYMTSQNLYPIPICNATLCENLDDPLDSEDGQRKDVKSRHNGHCAWLAKLSGAKSPFSCCSLKHRYYHSTREHHPFDPYQVNPDEKWPHYDPKHINSLQTSKGRDLITKITIEAANLEHFDMSEGVGPTVDHWTDNTSGAITFWIKESKKLVHDKQSKGGLMIRVRRYTSRTNHFLLQSVSSSLCQGTECTNPVELGTREGGLRQDLYHPIRQCESRVTLEDGTSQKCDSIAFYSLTRRPACRQHYLRKTRNQGAWAKDQRRKGVTDSVSTEE